MAIQRGKKLGYYALPLNTDFQSVENLKNEMFLAREPGMYTGENK